VRKWAHRLSHISTKSPEIRTRRAKSTAKRQNVLETEGRGFDYILERLFGHRLPQKKDSVKREWLCTSARDGTQLPYSCAYQLLVRESQNLLCRRECALPSYPRRLSCSSISTAPPCDASPFFHAHARRPLSPIVCLSFFKAEKKTRSRA
jgi:hypothetical protein